MDSSGTANKSAVMMMRPWITIVGSLLALLSGIMMEPQPALSQPGGGTFYVSSAGNDAWSGRLDAPNAQKNDGPFASLAKARDAVRALKRERALTGPVTVLLRGGIYYLTDTVTFTPEDSGTEQAPVAYKAYPGEQAFLSGGRLIGNWHETSAGGLRRWETALPAVRSGAWYFTQLFVRHGDGPLFDRRFRPTKGMLVIAGTTWSPARKTAAHRAAQIDFRFFPGDLQPWQNLDDVEVVALHSWSASRLRIAKLDTNQHIVTFTAMPTFRIGYWYKNERNPYYVENVKEELKQPGQWYLDRPTGVLTYLPLPGETLANTTIVAPKLERLVEIKGSLDGPRFVTNLHFENLGFLHTEWPLPMHGYDTSQGQPQLSSAVEVTAAKEIRFDHCIVANTGAYGIGLGVGSQDCAVTGCLMCDLGGGGVKVGDSTMNRNAVYPTLPTGNVITENTITDTGRIHYSANGIWCGVVKDTQIEHNDVSNNPYTGIAVGWCWDDKPSTCGGNLIEYNHVHNVMQLVQDGGGIYTLGRQPGTVIRGNLIHDCMPSPFACAPGQCGLYFDQGSSGFFVENNIQYNISWHPERINQNQNTAKEHDIRTNYLGIKPDDPKFPHDIAAKAGVEKEYRWALAAGLHVTPDPVYSMKWPKLPPVPTSFALDFEDIPVGECPRNFSRNGATGKAEIGVSEDTAKSGRKSLKFVDQRGLAKNFYPYLSRMGMDVGEGPVDFSFDVKQDKVTPARLWIELRDYSPKESSAYQAGPSFGLLADGKVMVAGKELTAIPAGEWGHIDVRFALGKGQPKDWEITVTLPDGIAKTVTAPFVKDTFTTLTGFIMSADADADGIVYVDNLALKVKETDRR